MQLRHANVICRIRIGTVNVVALSDIESIKKGLNNPVLQNRLRNVFLEQTGYPGTSEYTSLSNLDLNTFSQALCN